tara:strand:+ start:457 stop:609 length:153 start_codon:yes stop_codon:yes gene_type:complete
MAILFPMSAKKGKFIEILGDSWLFYGRNKDFWLCSFVCYCPFQGKLADWW